MKKKLLVALIAISSAICGVLVSSACDEKEDAYEARYKTEDCFLSVVEFNNIDNEINYIKRYTADGTAIYFDKDCNINKVIDNRIDEIYKLNALLKNNEFDCADEIYFSDKLINNYKVEDGEVKLTFKTDTSEEEALAWILRATSKSELPYGIYAGLASNLLEKEEYAKFAYSSISAAEYLTELQFPVYEKGNLPDGQRSYAWSFSNYLVSRLIKEGKSEKDILSMGIADLNLYLQNRLNVTLPDYSFYPYSTKYEYKVEQGCFTYYINKEFNDLILPKSRFDTSYNFISNWLKDNSRTAEESNRVFGLSTMYPINVYLDDGIKSNGISGETGTDYIFIYSVGSFSHEYIHHILYKIGKSGNLKEVFTELHADTSKYSNLMWYYLLSGSSETYPYSDETNERQMYLETIKLYNNISAFEASPENFSYWLFVDCFSSLYTKKDKKWINRAQNNSCMRFIADKYGSDYLWMLNVSSTVSIDGKSFEAIVEEWIDYLNKIIN